MTNSREKQRPIKVLVMSVGGYAKNTTARYMCAIGGAEHTVICLPKQYADNAASYERVGLSVYVYDERKYMNERFEYFGFTPRNCGGIGRQGIAEAVDVYGDDYICYQLDDDYAGLFVRSRKTSRQLKITTWANFERMVRLFDDFYNELGIEIASKTNATPPDDSFISSRKIYNNFVMRKGVRLNYDGFAALCSDDQRFNMMRNLIDATPMCSVNEFCVQFVESQGDRSDGNAVIYNSDCSWKKSFALRMMFPWACRQHVAKHVNRVLFLENIKYSRLYPPIMLADENGNIVERVNN